MSKYQTGEHIHKRCMKCFHDEMKVIKVTKKDLNDKTAYILWTQCPECGTNDHELAPENL